MIDRLIGFSIRFKLVVIFFTLLLVVWGLFGAKNLTIDAFPDITGNQVQVITQCPSLATEEVEQLVTAPIEMHLRNIPGAKLVRSISRKALSIVTVVFDDDVSTLDARQMVDEKLDVAKQEIPENIDWPEKAPISSGLGEIFQYVIKPKKGYDSLYSPMELRTIQERIVKRQLSGIDGVVEVNSVGGFIEQEVITVNLNALLTYELSISDVVEAVRENVVNFGLGNIEKNGENYFIRGLSMPSETKEIEGIFVLKDKKKIPLHLIAKVIKGAPVRFGALTYNGEGEVSGGMVLMVKDGDASKVVDDVKKKVEEIAKSLPAGLDIIPFIDRSKLINRTTNTVLNNALEGGLIVIFVLILMLGSWKAGLIVASVIPLSMCFAFGLMYAFGISANLMSLGAIDFGVVVDGAVIIVEAIMVGFLMRNTNDKDEIVRSSAVSIRKSAAFGELIILLVYFPIIALVGIEGKLFKPMALTVAFAILGALLLSLTYVPMMSALLLNKKSSKSFKISDSLIAFLKRIYAPILAWVLRLKWMVIAAVLILFFGAFFTFKNMGGVFVPRLEEGDLMISFGLKPGTSLAKTIETAQRLEKVILTFDEVEQVCTKIGTAEIPTDPMPMESGDMVVVLKPKSEWLSAESLDALILNMKKKLKVIPGCNVEFTQPIEHLFNTLISGVRSDIAVKIFGDNLDILDEKARLLKSLVKELPGIGDVSVEETKGMPQIEIMYDYAALARFGLYSSEVNKCVQTAILGEKVSDVIINNRKIDLVVRAEKLPEMGIEYIKSLLINTPDGPTIRLDHLAKIKYVQAPVQVSRENANRRIVVGINTRQGDLELTVSKIKNIVDGKLNLPPGYYVNYGGQFENMQKAKERLSYAVPLALAIIFVLLYFTFHSLGQTLLIFTAIPLSAIGGVGALWIREMPFSISAGIGFIALFGIAVLNGIVLISSFNEIRKNGEKDVFIIVTKGCLDRLRPVLITATVAALGFLPMAISNSDGAEVQRPLATVVIGGLVSATLLTLLVLPLLYSIFYSGRKRGLKTMSILVLIIGCKSGYGQNSVLDKLVVNAVEHSVELKNQGHELKLLNLSKSSQLSFNSLGIDLSLGQMNSVAFDYNLTVSQEVSFNTHQNNWLENKIKDQSAMLELNMIEIEILVSKLYCQLSAASVMNAFWKDLMPLINDFKRFSELKFKSGEIDAVDRIRSNIHAAEMETGFMESQSIIFNLEEELKFLCRTDSFNFDTSLFSLELPVFDSLSINNGLLARKVEYQNALQLSEITLNRQNYAPKLKLGYFNQQMDYIGGFQGILIGASFPLVRKQLKIINQKEKLAGLFFQERSQLILSSVKYEIDVLLRQINLLDKQLELMSREWNIAYKDYFRLINQQLAASEINVQTYLLLWKEVFDFRKKYIDLWLERSNRILDLKRFIN